jgi:5'(3')-deoxyribonucleotidase
MNDKQFVLGVDLDGVVADFYGGLRSIAAEWLGVKVEKLSKNVSYGLHEWNLKSMGGYDNLHRFAVTQRDLFQQLKPLRGAPAALRRLSTRGLRIRIITHRLYIKFFHEKVLNQTIIWLDKWGIPYWDLCFLKDKAAVGADLYLEDSPDNVVALRKAKNKVICLANSTNKKIKPPRVKTWKEMERLIIKEHKDWKKRR